LLAKQNAKPSSSFKLFMNYDPEAVLWLGFTTKAQAVQERFNLFLKVWPEARQRIPHALLQELRITPELPIYNELVEQIFLELIDGRLTTPEEMRAYLEPHSPPAPPPQVTIKRPRAKRGAEAKIKEQVLDEDEELEEGLPGDDDLEPIGADDDEIDLGLVLPKLALATELGDETESEEEEELEGEETSAASAGKNGLFTIKGEKPAPRKAEKPLAAAKPQPPVAAAAAKVGPAPKPAPAAKPAAKAPTPIKANAPAQKPAKTAAKAPAKKSTKPAPPKAARPKPKPAAKPSKKSAGKKHASKKAKKR
jgi:hypothetical protein